MNKKIAIIGGGNLGTAIAEGLLKAKFCKAGDITITKRNTGTLKEIQSKGVKVTTNNSEAVRNSELIILAVKPFQIIDVLNDLKKEFGFTVIFISHDLSVVRYISDRIMVMQKGRIEEMGTAEQIYFHPKTAYTKKLISSIPKLSL